MKKIIFIVTMLLGLVSFSQDSTVFVNEDSLEIKYGFKGYDVFYCYKRFKGPVTGWVKSQMKNQITYTYVSGSKNGIQITYKKRGKYFNLISAKYYIDGYCIERFDYKIKSGQSLIKSVTVYNYDFSPYQKLDKNISWIITKFKKQGVKVSITFEYGANYKTQRIKFSLTEPQEELLPKAISVKDNRIPLKIKNIRDFENKLKVTTSLNLTGI